VNENKLKTICVVGLGYIGLPTAVVLASRGTTVIGVDVNKDVVAKINRGEIHIVEPDLDAVTARVVQNGLLRAATAPVAADAFVIAVPTPFHENKADLTYVHAAAASVAPVLKKGDLVVLESTSPPGTTESMVTQLAALRPDLRFPKVGEDGCDVHVAYCPERVLPGRVLVELVENDRVIGGITPECSARAEELYQIFCTSSLLKTGVRTAEMCKLTENSFRDVGIAFANELSIICEKLGINVWEVIRLARQYSAAGAGCWRSLHRGGSMVHCAGRAGGVSSHPHRARSERRQAPLRSRKDQGCCCGRAIDWRNAEGRFAGIGVQARRRRLS